MKRKALQLLSLCAVLIFLLSACGNSTANKNTASSGSLSADSPDNETEAPDDINTSFSESGQTNEADQINAGLPAYADTFRQEQERPEDADQQV